MKTNERTLKMMENYMTLREQGFSNVEIAKKFDLSPTTLYSNLGEIAEQNGVTRESLLERVFVADHSGRNFTQVKPVDRANFELHFQTLISEFEQLVAEISGIIEDNETMYKILQEEQK